MSVIATCVLLNVARMLAIPTEIFFAPLTLMIFFAFGSSASNSAAVGAAGAATGSAVAAGLAPSGAAPSAFSFFAGLACPSAAGAFAVFSAASGFASFLGAAFFGFVSSAIVQKL